MPPALTDEASGASDEDIHDPVEKSETKKQKAVSVHGSKALIANMTSGVKEEEEEGTQSQDEEQNDEEEGEEEEEEEGEEEEEYVVERILDHMIDEPSGEVRFRVKWLGYEKKNDQTWEPEENLTTGASQLLDDYYELVGGREFVLAGGKTKKKRGRQSAASLALQPINAKRRKAESKSSSSTPPPAKQVLWAVPSGSWEEEVQAIDAIEEVNGVFQVYLHWSNGRRTQHPREMCNKRCPQKMLKFYEAHTSFLTPSRASEAATNVVAVSLKRGRGRPPKKS